MLLDDIWGETSNHRALVVIKDGVVKHGWPANTQAAVDVAKKLDEQGADVYFSVGAFSEKARKAALASQGAMFLDIDCGEGKDYPSKRLALFAILQWCSDNSFYRPSHLVDSGNGVHVYWMLDEFYPRDVWVPVAEHLKQALSIGGVRIDPTVTADAARILRVPGTHNHKNPESPLKVRVISRTDQRLALHDFQSNLPQVGPRPAAYKSKVDVWSIPAEFPPGDAEAIASKCLQMKGIKDKQGAVAEPYWRAGLSILQRCVNNEYYIKEWSKGDERYNEADALDKAEKTKGPYTCTSFNQANPLGCTGCPYAGKVTSPIQLKAGEDTKTTKIGSFVLTGSSIIMDSEEGQEVISDVPLWIEEVRVGARTDGINGRSTLEAHWITLGGKKQVATVPQRSIHDPKEFTGWLADQNLISGVRDRKKMQWYISEFTKKIEQENGTRVFHEVLGWHEDGFVLGDKTVNKDGSVPALVQTSSTIKNIKSKGTLEAWKAGVANFSGEKYRPHAFAILAGFGSPLLYPSNKQSAVISLVGQSGAGKTMAANAALSIYGNPEDLSLGASSTMNTVTKQMESCRHVPFLLDEVTQYSNKKLTQFIYDAANGQPKSSLTRTRENRQTYNWKLASFITSNSPVLENTQSEVQEAHRRRLLEIMFNGALEGGVGSAVGGAITNNYGVAGEVYLQALCKIQDKIPAMIDRAVDELKRRYNIPEANRFGLWTLAVSKVGGLIAKKIGLIDYDVSAIIDFAAKALATQAGSTLEAEELAEQAMSEWLSKSSKHICYWLDHERLSIPVDAPIARVLQKTVYVHKAEFSKMLKDKNISRNFVTDWLEGIQTEPPRKVRLCAGVPPIACYILDKAKLGFETEELDNG